jgi:uncharacterized membrane protein
MVQVGWPVLRLLLVPVAVACFLATLPADLAYWASERVGWADLAAWLITIGMVAGVLASIAGMLGQAAQAVPCRAANALVLVLSFFNMLAHSRPWTQIVPTGLLLSVGVVALLPFTCWLKSRR